MNQKTKTILKSALIVFAFALSVSALAIWSPPGDNPIGDGVASPLNVSANTQIKPAGLVLWFLRVSGLVIAESNVEVGGRVIIGQPAGGGSPTVDGPAALEVNSTTQGILLPRMTKAQRDTIANPVDGLMIYQTDDEKGVWIRIDGVWANMSTGLTTPR